MLPALIFGTGVLVTLEFIVIGILPLLAGDLGISLERAGWLVSAFALSAAVIGPLAILFTAGWQPRDSLALGLLLVGTSSLALLLAPNFWSLLLTRTIQGAILTHFVSLASATTAENAGKEKAGQAVGQVNLGVVLGTVFAVPIGVALADRLSWQAVFAGLGILATAGAGLVRISVPLFEAEKKDSCQLSILGKPRFLVHLLLSALVFTAMFSSYSYIAGYLEEIAGFASRDVALALFGFGAAGIFGNWVASRWVGVAPVLVTLVVAGSLVLITASLPLASETMSSLAIVLLAWGAAHTAAFVACQVRAMFAEYSAPAFAASLNISVCNLGIAAGAFIGGKVISNLGIGAVGAGTVVIGILSAVVGIALMLWQSREDRGVRSLQDAA